MVGSWNFLFGASSGLFLKGKLAVSFTSLAISGLYLPTSQAWCRDFWHKEVLPRAKDAQLALVLWRLCKVTSQKLGLPPLFPWSNFSPKKNSCENMASAKWVFFGCPPKIDKSFASDLKWPKNGTPVILPESWHGFSGGWQEIVQDLLSQILWFRFHSHFSG